MVIFHGNMLVHQRVVGACGSSSLVFVDLLVWKSRAMSSNLVSGVGWPSSQKYKIMHPREWWNPIKPLGFYLVQSYWINFWPGAFGWALAQDSELLGEVEGVAKEAVQGSMDPWIVIQPYPLVNIQKTIEHGHRNSWFAHFYSGDFP